MPKLKQVNVTIARDAEEEIYALYCPIFEALAGLDELEHVNISVPVGENISGLDLVALDSKLLLLSLASYTPSEDKEWAAASFARWGLGNYLVALLRSYHDREHQFHSSTSSPS